MGLKKKKQKFDRSPGQTHLLVLESLPERQGVTEAHPGHIDTGGSHIWEHSTMWTLLLAAAILAH